MELYELKEETERVILVGVATRENEDVQESLDELEELVNQIAPTAEFKRTILAEQYRQSLSIDHIEEIVPSSDEGDDSEE